jgi:rod shape-determining protein MreD
VSEDGSGYWVILISLLVALLLATLPLDRSLAWWRPEWPLLVLVYWAIALPHRVGLLTALLTGLLLDVVDGAPIGQHMLSLAIVITLARLMYQRLRVFTLAQQASVLFILVGLHQLIGHWLLGLQGVRIEGFAFLFPALSSALLWPPVMLLLRGLRRSYSVS